jgi:hypothetical protein
MLYLPHDELVKEDEEADKGSSFDGVEFGEGEKIVHVVLH